MTEDGPARYSLRPFEKSDVATVTRWFVDLDDLALFDRNQRIPHNLEAAEKSWAEALGNDGSNGKYWFTIDDAGGSAVGIVGLESVSPINGDAVIPLYMERSNRSKGVGVRAVALVMDLAFIQLGLNRLTSYYRADNARSRSLTERVGFRQEGCMRQAWFAAGSRLDMIVVGILRDEWMERRTALAAEFRPTPLVVFGDPSSRRAWSWPPAGDLDET